MYESVNCMAVDGVADVAGDENDETPGDAVVSQVEALVQAAVLSRTTLRLKERPLRTLTCLMRLKALYLSLQKEFPGLDCSENEED